MTVTRDQTGTGADVGGGSATAVVTWATAPAAGAKVLIFIGCDVAVTSVKDNGSPQATFTQDLATASSPDNWYVYRADGISLPSSGSYAVTVTCSTAADISASGRSYLGVATGGPTGTNHATGSGTTVTPGNVTPSAVGALLFGGFIDFGSAETITLTTSGASTVYSKTSAAGFDGASADNIATTTAAQSLAWTHSANGWFSSVAVYAPAVTSVTHPGAAALSGAGSLTAAALVTQPAAAALTGTGSLTGTVAVAIPAAVFLLGTGALTASADVMAPGQVAANLAGTGTLTAGVSVGLAQAAALSGSGTLTAQYTGLMLQAVTLAGSGTIAVAAAEALKFTAGLFGAGFLSIPQVAGGLVNGVGGASTPQALPGSSQVAVAPPGSSNWQWLGTLGQVTALTYSYVCPGGCDQMTCTIMVPAAYRTQLFYPGWKVRITRGGHQVWDGKIDQAQFSAGQGWSLSAVGTGNRGTDFMSFFAPGDVWPAGEPDEILNRAIARGLPWVNPGYNSSPIASQFWMGQATDPGSSTVTAFLNLICSRGGLTWYVNSQPGGAYAGDDLQIFPLPTVPNRLLVCTTPVPRSLGGYVNSLVIRFCSVADNATTGTAASFDVVSAINQPSVAAHGTLEQYLDLSDVGQMSASAAQAVGSSILQSYVAASYAGPFAVSHGQLLNMGGQAVDIGADQAGSMVKLVLTDDAYGGSPAPNIPVTFIVGSYSYDDFTQTATIAPYQSLNESLSGLLGMTNTTMTAITVAS